MPVRTPRTPSYRHHRPTGQAVVTLGGRDFYLGKFGSAESRAEYDRLVAEWLASGRALAPPTPGVDTAAPTVAELILAYVRFAGGYYLKDGAPTSEVANIKNALRPLRRLYAHTGAKDFGPLALKAVRQALIEAGLCRGEVNKRVRHVVRMFRWAVENELVPPSVHHGLKAVAGLKRGRSEARESPPVRPVAEAHVEAIRTHVAPQIWAMVELQRLTGMRPGEATIMRTVDLDRSGTVWAYSPSTHKTEHHGRTRTIYLGPRAQEVVKPWLRADPAAYLFSAREALDAHMEGRRAARKSPMTPSQAARARKKGRKRPPGDHYERESYSRAIAAGCKKAGVPHWHPHQLRHNAATHLRKEFSLEVARVVLGHSSAAVTEVYAEADNSKAIEAMGKVG